MDKSLPYLGLGIRPVRDRQHSDEQTRPNRASWVVHTHTSMANPHMRRHAARITLSKAFTQTSAECLCSPDIRSHSALLPRLSRPLHDQALYPASLQSNHYDFIKDQKDLLDSSAFCDASPIVVYFPLTIPDKELRSWRTKTQPPIPRHTHLVHFLPLLAASSRFQVSDKSHNS